MTATLNDVAKKTADDQSAEQQPAAELGRLAKAQGLSLTGPDRLPRLPTKTVLETALYEDIAEQHPQRHPASRSRERLSHDEQSSPVRSASVQSGCHIDGRRRRTMQTRVLGRTGPVVSALGLGAMGMSAGAYGAPDRAESIATVHAAIEAGVTLIDTEDFYAMGHNE